MKKVIKDLQHLRGLAVHTLEKCKEFHLPTETIEAYHAELEQAIAILTVKPLPFSDQVANIAHLALTTIKEALTKQDEYNFCEIYNVQPHEAQSLTALPYHNHYDNEILVGIATIIRLYKREDGDIMVESHVEPEIKEWATTEEDLKVTNPLAVLDGIGLCQLADLIIDINEQEEKDFDKDPNSEDHRLTGE